jgi:BASS family bile acid:Na+ symporter
MDRMSGASHFLHRHLLTLVILSYGLAAVWPAMGLWIKDAEIVELALPGGRIAMTLPKLLLSLLLFTAGMRVRVERIKDVIRRPGVMCAGLAANLAVPLLVLGIIVVVLRSWHNVEEAAGVLVGLALVTSMPIAGSSTGWTQAADGDMELSLGLVLGSTVLSPVTTPGLLRALGWFAPGQCGEILHRMAGTQTGAFLSAWVLLPSLLGMTVRWSWSDVWAASLEQRLKILAPATLLVLCYANASSCLPVALGQPDWDFLGLILAFVTGLCIVTFAAGYVLGRLLQANRREQISLMFGLGMNNNGTGLVLASIALGSQPMVMLPIIIYNLAQHVVAGCVNALLRQLCQRDTCPPAPGERKDR